MGSMEKGRWKCTDITELKGIVDSNMNNILLKYGKFSEKAQWYCYTRKVSVAGKILCWQTDVRSLESEFDERALRMCTARVLRYFGAHYIVGNFRWLSELRSSSLDLL